MTAFNDFAIARAVHVFAVLIWIGGVAFVTLVLLLFLGSPRAALIVALTIPMALLLAFVFMHHAKIPANLLSDRKSVV